jgi:hypothetical protein
MPSTLTNLLQKDVPKGDKAEFLNIVCKQVSAPLLGEDIPLGFKRRFSAIHGSLGNEIKAYLFSSSKL